MRTAQMTTRDIGNSTIAKLYDQCREEFPARTERYRERARRDHPRYSPLGVKRVALERFERDDPGLFEVMRKKISVPRPEPRRTSPTEQIKSLTSILNPDGELTGGNFGAQF